MKVYEILASLKQPSNQKIIKIRVHADDIRTAQQLAQAEYAGSDLRIRGIPKEIKEPKLKK